MADLILGEAHARPDLFHGPAGLLGELADFGGNHPEPGSELTRTRCFDGGIQRQELRLAGDAGDPVHEFADVAGALLQRASRPAGLVDMRHQGFEELTGADEHEALLWGNAAFVLGRLLIRGFVSSGWDMEPGDELELDDLPALVRGRGDDRKLQACAEAYIGERGYEKLLSSGLVPVLSFEQRAAVRLARMQSIAEPAAALTAAWT